MSNILITREIPQVGVRLLEAAGHTVTVWPKDCVMPRKELLKRAKGNAALMTMLTDKVDAELLDAAGPELKVVANFAVGYDNFNLADIKQKNVIPTNTPGVLDGAVSEHAMALLMAIAKRIPESERFLRKGKYTGWAPLLLIGTELKGKTLGIVGTGRIGTGVLKRAIGMEMKVAYYDVKRNEELEKTYGATFMSLEDLLKNADFISIHVPLLPATRHLINTERLAMMKPTAYLINTSRGPVVDEEALALALKAKTIAGAALDVYEHEPKVHPLLLKLENVVLTPHTASATMEARNAMAELAANGIIMALKGGVPPNAIKS